MQVFFCDRCTRRVTEGELAEEEGLRIGDLVFCRFCLEEPEVQEYLAQAAAADIERVSRTGFHRAVRDRGDASSSGRRCSERRTPRHGHRHAKTKTPPHGRRAPACAGEPHADRRPARPASPVPSRPAAGAHDRPCGPAPAMESVGGSVNGGHGPHRALHHLRKLESGQEDSDLWLLYGSVGIAIGFVIAVVVMWLG